MRFISLSMLAFKSLCTYVHTAMLFDVLWGLFPMLSRATRHKPTGAHIISLPIIPPNPNGITDSLSSNRLAESTENKEVSQLHGIIVRPRSNQLERTGYHRRIEAIHHRKKGKSG